MKNKIIDKGAKAAKAIVALATPVLTTLALDVLAELSQGTEVGIAAAATALIVWLTPNRTAQQEA